VKLFLVALAIAGQGGKVLFSDLSRSFVVRSARNATIDPVKGSSNYSFTLDGNCRVEQNARGIVMLADHMDGVAVRTPDNNYSIGQGNATGNVDFVFDSANAAKFNNSPSRPDHLSDHFELTSDAAKLATEADLQSITLPHPFKAVDHRVGLTNDADHSPYVEDMTYTASSGKFFFIPAEGSTPAKLQTGSFEGPVHIHMVKTLNVPEKPPVVTDYDVTGDRMTFDFTKLVGEVVITGNVHWKVEGGYGGNGDADKVTINTDAELKPTGIHMVGEPTTSQLIFPPEPVTAKPKTKGSG